MKEQMNENTKKLILVTGGFDPLHSGHIALIAAARQLDPSNGIVVGVNSDNWLIRKKGKFFLPYTERQCLVGAMRDVRKAFAFNDDDGSAKDAILIMLDTYPDHQIIFCNGGDRTATNIPEMDIVDDRLSFAFGIGGDNKINSSSWILNTWLGEANDINI